jgi:putative DNA methylase
VIYAFKQAEETDSSGGLASTGWETMLEGLLGAGLSVSGTWPLRTEGATRLRGISSNALASSIALVCRQRSTSAPLATRKDFINALRAELPDALRHLQQGNIAPVDLAQAAIGPGMSIFSRYVKVVEADGRAMSVRSGLELINEVLDETLAEQEGDFDADTRWAVAWFEQQGVSPGQFGMAETLSKAKNTAVDGLVQAGIVEAKAGKVRLLERAELLGTWDPVGDDRLTVWEVTQHLIRALETGGEASAADLLHRVGGLGEISRELAYRLYTICERKKWPQEALAYNGLVVAWPEIVQLASALPMASIQQELL